MSKWTGYLFSLSLALVAATSVAAGNEPGTKMTGKASKNPEKATFAGGCFWCMESPFDKLPGVVSVTVGYTGGTVENPTYEQVSAGVTGHADPTVKDRQFCDVGSQYRPGIFYHSEEQRLLALRSKEALEKTKPFKEPILTEVTAAGEFYPAEEYHQHYYRKNPIRYKYYRSGCGRDRRLKELWGDAAGH
jgi:peptide-methionine (S)-S-oxide reductase